MPKDLFEGKDNAIIAARLTEKSEIVVGKIAAGVGIWGGRKSRGGILGKKGKMEKIWRGINARFCGSEFPSLVVGRRGRVGLTMLPHAIFSGFHQASFL
jgi:hypothetical protein